MARPGRVALAFLRDLGGARGVGRPRRVLRAARERDRVRCLALLEAMPEGQGSLHSIRMSVIDAWLDLYGWLRLIAVHAERHVRQLERGPRPASEAGPTVS